ncbi:AHH domain-containing protein [Pedobacter immunditicola]|uniref:AHH domain-containing protein n=1 Tax=Pedobacter immunditicola TaxID=3133440 RepID=UPI00309856FD
MEELRLSIPVGKSSLDVIQVSPNECIPKFDNLTIKGDDYSKEVNEVVLSERRKQMAPYLQFPTDDNLQKIGAAKLKLGKQSCRRILAKNLLAAMDPLACKISNAFGGKEAHHVVEGNDINANGSRDILEKFDIDINHPINGIFLPGDKNSIYKGTLHKGSHSKEYAYAVYNRIKNATTKEELITELNNIKHDLFNGRLKLEGKFHSINKNNIYK